MNHPSAWQRNVRPLPPTAPRRGSVRLGLGLRRFLAAVALAVVAPAAAARADEPIWTGPSADFSRGRLVVSDDGRWLRHADGTPFFYLGDTAWELFHRLGREEAELYLKDRASKGFTVIQAVALAELDGQHTPNPYGAMPLESGDPAKPNEAYFRHVDFIVDRAEALGIAIGMLPTWGDKWNKKWGVGPEVFTPDNAEQYGEWLGRRYRQKPIIWILGGDRNPETDRHREIIRAMARGLARGDGGNHLMTYHPQGGSNSSQWFHGDAWLSFNMFQSGHAQPNLPNYEMTLKNYALKPPKPTLDGEPRYEDHPIRWKPEAGWFDEWDVRQAAYWSMLSGACGHTYGDHNIWQMWQPGRKPISAARTPWREALKHPGSSQMGWMRRLFESRPWQQLVPDQQLLAGDPGRGADHQRAARAADGSFAFIYAPTGRTIDVRLDRIAQRPGEGKVQAWWFDPRSGRARPISTSANRGVESFDPPGEPGRGNDWVLVLDDAARGWPAPGSR